MIKDLSARVSVPAKLGSGPCPTLILTSSAERILSEYGQYLDRTLGAALSTRRGYLYFARRFLTYAFRSMDPEWKAVRAESVAQFVQEEAAPRKGNGRKTPGYATRAFLRFWSYAASCWRALMRLCPSSVCGLIPRFRDIYQPRKLRAYWQCVLTVRLSGNEITRS